MLRWVRLLCLVAAAANLVLLADLVHRAEPVWRTAMVGGAAACLLAALALSIKLSGTANSPPSPSPPPSPPGELNSQPDSETPAEKVSADPLHNKPWLKLVEECVEFYDELDRLHPDLDADSAGMVDHCRCRLLAILQRCGVNILSDDTVFDRKRHRTDVRLHRVREVGTVFAGRQLYASQTAANNENG